MQASVFRYPFNVRHPAHAVHVFAHGPHSLGLAQGAGEAAIWTTLARAWIHEQATLPG